MFSLSFRTRRHTYKINSLSEQLYQKTTHFLLELIQNADDNSYRSGVSPTLSISLDGDYLRVDCNEIGFQPDQIEAICTIAWSTKKRSSDSTYYVGEKGIGFKSVFKAADVVWICSGYYQFKFDRNAILGMIAPVWEKFPEDPIPGHTSFLLKLSSKCNRKELAQEIQSLQPTLLIFLRKLRTLKLKIGTGNPSGLQNWENTLSRADGTERGFSVTSLKEKENVSRYILCKKKISGLPKEEKRPGVSQSELVLAFPVTQNYEPKPSPQSVYSFLPVRNYGFEVSFQIQWSWHPESDPNPVSRASGFSSYCEPGGPQRIFRLESINYFQVTTGSHRCLQELRHGY